MKTPTPNGASSVRPKALVRASLVLLSVAMSQAAFAQQDRATPPATNAAPAAAAKASTAPADATTGNVQSKATADQAVSPTVQDILKMSDAGVSSGVILAFVQASRTSYAPTSADLIALKQHNVPDEVTSALMKRGSEVEAQKVIVKRDPVAPTVVKQLSSGTDFDPESYEFWQNHYAYPRALTYSYRTLSPLNLGYGYGYGYGLNSQRSPYGPRRW